MRQVDIEGYSADEILNLPEEQVDELCFVVDRLCFEQAARRYWIRTPTDYESRNASSYELDYVSADADLSEIRAQACFAVRLRLA